MVIAPDWNDNKQCGNGLHGLLFGSGDYTLLNWSPDAVWVVFEIVGKYVDLVGKIKCEKAIIRCVGDLKKATDYIIAKGADPTKCIGAFLSSGHKSTLTGGDWSTLTGGDKSTLTFKIYDGFYYRMHVFYVGENGVKAGVKYEFENGSLVEK
jgi:hypothetical protein